MSRSSDVLLALVILLAGKSNAQTEPGNNSASPADALSGAAVGEEGSIENIEKNATQGDPIAQWGLGIRYRDGRGVNQDYRQAFTWFMKSAVSGLSLAQTQVAYAYEFGRGTPQNYALEAYWDEKAARQGDPEGALNIGIAYEVGEGVPKDLVLAHAWLNIAAAQGNDDVFAKAARIGRDKIATELNDAQLREAQVIATRWGVGHGIERLTRHETKRPARAYRRPRIQM